MDPLTQGALGAALPQATLGRSSDMFRLGALGFLAGMAADLDVLLRSTTDPLAFLAYHRQFTHALIFIPFGGLISAVVLQAVFGRRWGFAFRRTFLACTLGYATHGLLDAATAYGTLLLWPFSDARVSFSIVSIIDPLFTLPLLAGVIAAAMRRSPVPARVGLVWAAFYFALGVVQQSRAVSVAESAAAVRGLTPLRVVAKPSFGNLIVWKTITETADSYHVDAVRAGWTAVLLPGATLAKLDVARDLPWLTADTQQARDVERFRRFSQGYVAMDPQQANRVIDVRYSFVPNDVAPLWSIELSPDAAAQTYAVYATHRTRNRENTAALLRMILGRKD